MSHLNSSTVHSTKAFTAGNVSPLHQSGSTTMKIAPVSVLVNWSESNRFESGIEMDFVAFESLALEAALQNRSVAMIKPISPSFLKMAINTVAALIWGVVEMKPALLIIAFEF